MKWFNHMESDIPTPAAIHKREGKRFIVWIDAKRKHRSQFCQVGPKMYRFISPDGNRIVDDNKEIISAKEIKP